MCLLLLVGAKTISTRSKVKVLVPILLLLGRVPSILLVGVKVEIAILVVVLVGDALVLPKGAIRVIVARGLLHSRVPLESLKLVPLSLLVVILLAVRGLAIGVALGCLALYPRLLVFGNSII